MASLWSPSKVARVDKEVAYADGLVVYEDGLMVHIHVWAALTQRFIQLHHPARAVGGLVD
jgi:hypothetical protein